MFLEMLSDEQKELFMNLAVKAAEANEEVEDSEKEMLRQFAQEMKVDLKINSDMVLEDILAKLKELCGQTERRIIVFELIGILFSDKLFDEQERGFLNNVAKNLDVTEETLNQLTVLVERYIVLYSDIFDVVIKA